MVLVVRTTCRCWDDNATFVSQQAIHSISLFCSWTCLIVLSWAFTVIMVSSCQFALIGGDGQGRDDRGGFGFFNYESENGTCERMEESIDRGNSGMKAGRVFAVLQSLLISAVFIMALALALMSPVRQKLTHIVIRVVLYCCIWCQLFSFFILETTVCKFSIDNNEYNCKLGGAGIVAVLNVLLLTGLVVASLFVAVPVLIKEEQ